jgi:hypothetical protein
MTHRAAFDALLAEAAAKRASDLHLRVGQPPLVRIKYRSPLIEMTTGSIVGSETVPVTRSMRSTLQPPAGDVIVMDALVFPVPMGTPVSVSFFGVSCDDIAIANTNDTATTCMATHFFHLAMKGEPQALTYLPPDHLMDQIVEDFEDSNFNAKTLLKSILLSPTYLNQAE